MLDLNRCLGSCAGANRSGVGSIIRWPGGPGKMNAKLCAQSRCQLHVGFSCVYISFVFSSNIIRNRKIYVAHFGAESRIEIKL